MKRRSFAALLGTAIVSSRAVRAQNKQARIGFIEPGTQEANSLFLTAFRAALAAQGWNDGQNLTIVDRWLGNRPERVPEVVAGLLAERVDLLVTAGSLATRGAIATAPGIPIVMVGVGDPIRFGFAQSLARPGGNVTGVTNTAVDLVSKRLQLLLELARPQSASLSSRTPMIRQEATWAQTRDAAVKLGLAPTR